MVEKFGDGTAPEAAISGGNGFSSKYTSFFPSFQIVSPKKSRAMPPWSHFPLDKCPRKAYSKEKYASTGFAHPFPSQRKKRGIMATYTSKGANGDVVLFNPVPEAEYMYGCVPTAVGMLLGYYDLYGYRGTALSNVIDGPVALKSRGTDGNKYNMNEFDTALGRAIATKEYVYRFYSHDDIGTLTANNPVSNYNPTTPQDELPYSFAADGVSMNTSVWNCLADYLGTGQYWRGNGNLSTTNSYCTLEDLLGYTFVVSIDDGTTHKTIDYQNTAMLYGLDLYVKSKGYSLDYEITGAYVVDVAGGSFTFEDYMAEIDAGRPVIVSIEGHAMVGYGYNAESREIIFDDCYNHDKKMVWDSTYHYSNADRKLQSITVIGFNVNGDMDLAVVPISGSTQSLVLSDRQNATKSADHAMPGATVYASFAIKNTGSKESRDFAAGIYVDGELVSSSFVYSISSNSSRRIANTALTGLSVGMHNVRVKADYKNEIQELSGKNNVAEMNFLVLKSGTNIVYNTKTVNGGKTSRDDYVSGGARINVSSAVAFDTILHGTVTSSGADGSVRYYGASAYVGNDGCLSGAKVYEYGQVYVQFGGLALDTLLDENGRLTVSSGGSASGVEVHSKAKLQVQSGGKLTGGIDFASGASASMDAGAILDFDISKLAPGAGARVNNLSAVKGAPVYTLTVSGTQKNGKYTLAKGASGFFDTVKFKNVSDIYAYGTLTLGQTANIGGVDYTLELANDVLSVTVGSAVQTTAARGDRDGNGVSDVMFVWTGNNCAHGYWMNGSSEWWSANSTGVSADWDNLGSYDMSGDGKADAVLFGNVVVNGAKGAYIGYYQDGDDASGWVNIGYLDNSSNVAWKNCVGNLTGGTANSIVWFAPELCALGAWTDGTQNWVSMSSTFNKDWTLVGCGDFNGDGKDSVLMSYGGGQIFYSANLDGSTAKMGALNWSGWDVRAIGDFAGDGKDDVVLFHKDTGSMVMLKNGSADDYASIGQLDPKDWFVAGCGDYNCDGADDLLVRQYSTGMLGYYSNGDQGKWVELGRGVDMNWTVIA